jgi:hypothetical protein
LNYTASVWNPGRYGEESKIRAAEHHSFVPQSRRFFSARKSVHDQPENPARDSCTFYKTPASGFKLLYVIEVEDRKKEHRKNTRPS